jgi:hypothetical protein
MTSAVALIPGERVTTEASNERLAVLKRLIELGWPKPAASAIAQTWLPLEEWGATGLQRFQNWRGTRTRPQSLEQATIDFISETLHGVLGKLGTTLRATDSADAAKTIVEPLWKLLGR